MYNMWCAKILFLLYFLNIFTNIYGSNEEELQISIRLFAMDLEDQCTDLANVKKQILLNETNSRSKKIELEKSMGSFIREESTRLRTNYDASNLELSHDTSRQWGIFNKMGDIEMSDESFNELITFINSNEELLNNLKIPCKNKTKNCTMSKKEIINTLSKSNDSDELKYIWTAVQNVFTNNAKQFPKILKLAEKAAKANDEENVKKYWEMLVEFPDAYETANTLWTEIEPFYTKFYKFVKSRLELHYSELKNKETIPVYLLGSEFGTDWSNIAPLVLPHRYLYDEITSMLKFDGIGGKKVYHIAEKLINSIGMKKPRENFWINSDFNQQCPSQLIMSCAERYTSVFTCNETGWTQYLSAHEDMMRVALNNVSYPATTYNSYRISALDEGLVSLSNILAIKNLPMAGIVPDDVFFPPDDDVLTVNNNEMTALFLAALRILPRLPYYLLADTWRLELLENENKLNPNKTVKQWWKLRQSIQKVSGVTNLEYDFLKDPYIIANKPYIGKFFGTILQFQVLEFFQNEALDGVNILTHMHDSEHFGTLLKDRAIYDWPKVLYDNFYYDVASDSLLEYFKPLEEYMDNAPTQQITQTVIPKTTTTTTVKTTTVKTEEITILTNDEPQPENIPIAKSEIIPKSRKAEPVAQEVTKPPLKDIPSLILNNLKTTQKSTPILASDTESNTNTSATATWIGGVVGVAALSVIIIVFARKKCRRKPVVNNRRFEA